MCSAEPTTRRCGLPHLQNIFWPDYGARPVPPALVAKTHSLAGGNNSWLLLFTLAAICWQSVATAESAKAAFVQIQMMKQKERARLEVQSFKDEFAGDDAAEEIDWIVKVSIKNFGSSWHLISTARQPPYGMVPTMPLCRTGCTRGYPTVELSNPKRPSLFWFGPMRIAWMYFLRNTGSSTCVDG